ncbi:MAG TPA: 2,3-bisphosphoglycerate-independent phosphoglycerate mutase [Firmicutes bacterium]|nr:2,3-bisphosphoglycerate-independent phosphoglycerate mutase [Bacillota bacterium]
MAFETIEQLAKPAESKMVLLVMDGLGGLPLRPGDLTELEKANTPNLDRLAKEGICGLHQPIAAGITPGSGPAHLALFGYDPVRYTVGRGVLAALGIGFALQDGDVAARGNFCTVDNNGIVIDRRAGRIPTEKNRELCQKLLQIALPGVELFIEPVKDYRFLLVLRGQNLSGELADTDPQVTGLKPLPPVAASARSEQTAFLVERFIEKAGEILADESPANMVLMRGFSQKPDWPLFPVTFGLKAAAIAAYPMYRGVSRLVGMDILETGSTLEDKLQTLKNHWAGHDFFFFHVKETDSAGEDGDFNRKVSVIEQVDRIIPEIMSLKPDVIAVTGDHSTPALLKSHSWHPVPVLLHSYYCRSDKVAEFGERSCVNGALGPRLRTTELIPLMMANANRLVKFGA